MMLEGGVGYDAYVLLKPLKSIQKLHTSSWPIKRS